MEHWFTVIFGGVVVGTIGMTGVGMALMMWEQKTHGLKRQTEDEKEGFTRCFQRMMTIVWVAISLLYISLTYWWK